MRQNEILLPDTKKKLKVKSFHPWTEYTTTSEALDLAIIGLGKGFKLSKTSLRYNGVKDLLHTESLTHSMSIYLVLFWKIELIFQRYFVNFSWPDMGQMCHDLTIYFPGKR